MEISTKQIYERVMRRAEEIKISRRKISLASGHGPDLVRDWGRDKAPLPRLDTLQKVAEVLNVTAGWLAFGEGDNLRGINDGIKSVPVVSWIAAGQFAEYPAAVSVIDEGDTIDVSGLGRGKFFGLRIIGDSMNRIAGEGSVIIVNADDRHLLPRKFYVFLNNRGTTFKRFMDKPDRLEPFSFNTDHEAMPITEETHVIGRAVKVISIQDI